MKQSMMIWQTIRLPVWRILLGIAGGAVCLLSFSVPGLSQPPTIEGSLSNFDVWNRTVFIANDFEVFLDGIVPGSITDVYNGALNPFAPPDASVTQEGSGTVIRWGPPEDGGQVNPGGMGHFGFQITGNLTPLGTIFRWSQNGEPLSPRVPSDGLTWKALTGQGKAGTGEAGQGRAAVAQPIANRSISVEAEVPNRSGSEVIWIQRRVNTSSTRVVLDDLLVGEPLDRTATLLDPDPIPLAVGDSVTFIFNVPPGTYAVMIVDYYSAADDGGVGEIQGTWLDAAVAGY
jgi:hypothetical protein